MLKLKLVGKQSVGFISFVIVGSKSEKKVSCVKRQTTQFF